MPINNIASICFIVICALLAATLQLVGAFICLSVSIVLFGFILWIDRNKIDKANELQNQINSLKDRIDTIQIARLTR